MLFIGFKPFGETEHVILFIRNYLSKNNHRQQKIKVCLKKLQPLISAFISNLRIGMSLRRILHKTVGSIES
jgi:hypothetical protein